MRVRRGEEVQGNVGGEDVLREGGLEEGREAFLEDAEGCDVSTTCLRETRGMRDKWDASEIKLYGVTKGYINSLFPSLALFGSTGSLPPPNGIHAAPVASKYVGETGLLSAEAAMARLTCAATSGAAS